MLTRHAAASSPVDVYTTLPGRWTNVLISVGGSGSGRTSAGAAAAQQSLPGSRPASARPAGMRRCPAPPAQPAHRRSGARGTRPGPRCWSPHQVAVPPRPCAAVWAGFTCLRALAAALSSPPRLAGSCQEVRPAEASARFPLFLGARARSVGQGKAKGQPRRRSSVQLQRAPCKAHLTLRRYAAASSSASASASWGYMPYSRRSCSALLPLLLPPLLRDSSSSLSQGSLIALPSSPGLGMRVRSRACTALAPVSAPSKQQAPRDISEMETSSKRSAGVLGVNCSLPDTHLIFN